jgi:hypothetical protein
MAPAVAHLRSHAAEMRPVFDRLVARSGGYQLCLAPGELDAWWSMVFDHHESGSF